MLRLILFYDLPFAEAQNRKSYTIFHKKLLSEGFFQMQYSIYSKVCGNIDIAKATIKKLECFFPNDGSVRILTITEKQFDKMYKYEQAINPQEEILKQGNLIVI